MYTCTYVHMYICTHVHMYTCTCVHTHVHVYIHMYMCTYTCTCVRNNLARVLSCISSQYCQGYKSIVWELAGIIELAIEYMPMRQKNFQNETEAIVIINKILNQT